MLNIYLCEDQPQQLEYFSTIIKKNLQQYPFETSWKMGTSDPEKLLNHLKGSKPSTGLYFLDIVLGHPVWNGVQLAREIRQIDPRGYIVFVTTHGELSYMALKYQVEPLDFILKDYPDELAGSFSKCIQTALKSEARRLENAEHLIPLKTGKIVQYMDSKDIFYIDTRNGTHRLYIHTTSGELSYYGSLNEVEEELSQYGFIRCHKSILVNTKHIVSLNEKERKLQLSNGEICMVSVNYLKTLKNLQKY